MVDGPPSRLFIRTSARNKVENSPNYCYLKTVQQRTNTLDLLPRFFIKLHRFETAFNVNNARYMKTTARKKGVFSKVSPVQRSTVKYEGVIPSMSLPQKLRLIRKTTRKTETQDNQQMLNIGSRLPNSKDTQKECKKLVIKLKRLRIEKQPEYVEGKVQGSCTENKCSEELYHPQPSLNVEALLDQCAFNLCKNPQVTKNIKRPVVKLRRIKLVQSKEKDISGCADVSNVWKNLTKSQHQVTNSIKRAVVRLKRFKLDSTSKPLTTASLAKGDRKTDAKMKIRSCGKMKETTNSNKYDFVPKPKEKSNHPTSSSKVFIKPTELITDLVMTPERRNNLKKLSLTKGSLQPKSTEICEISRFSPVRNSTVFGMGEKSYSYQVQKDISTNCTKRSGDSNESSKDNSNSREKRSRKSLTNQPDLIEQLLCSESSSEKEQENGIGVNRSETISHKTKKENRTHKFFHRIPETRSHSKKLPSQPENIFEFLSQSDTSGSEKGKHIDPAADIIKKMISAGKVRVAVNRRGTGRPVLKRCRPKNARINKSIASKGKGKKEKKAKTIIIKPTGKDVYNTDDGNTILPPVLEYVEEGHNDATEYFNDQLESDDGISEGGFSRLARSVLLKQTKKYGNSRKKDFAEQRRLLEMARKFVSTPATNRENGAILLADLSPIQTLSTQRRPVCPSPWRIDTDAHLPRVFNFTKNTSCMPSFSSDYIPATPVKSKQNKNSLIFNDSKAFFERSAVTGEINANNTPQNLTTSDSSAQLQGSLGSSNDSNAENVPPPALTPAQPVQNKDSSNMFNLLNLPNSRRTLEYRSPLKAINIIEVMNLPPWKNPVNNDAQNVKPNDATVACDSSKYDNTHNTDDLFGFEEFLDPNTDDDELPSADNITKASRQSINRNLHKKLKELKKWLPKNSDHGESNTIIKPCSVFGDNEGRPKQRLIKEMLCSTMIDQKNNKSTGQVENTENNTVYNSDGGNVQPIENDFFNDYEPETTFDKKPQRTYARPVKRKRKCLKNFVMYPDSNEESSVDSDEEQRARRKVGQKKRRNETLTKAKENRELKSFVDEFTSMCKEVENYELLVE